MSSLLPPCCATIALATAPPCCHSTNYCTILPPPLLLPLALLPPLLSLSLLPLLLCNGFIFFLLSNLHLILSYVVSYLHILSYSSLDLCIVLCALPHLMSYSLAPSSTMMSCIVHSPMDSLVQPTCILVYIECNPAPGGSPFELSLGLRSSGRVLLPPSLLRVSCVVVCPRFCLGSPHR